MITFHFQGSWKHLLILACVIFLSWYSIFCLQKVVLFCRKEVFPVFITVLENTRDNGMNKILCTYFMISKIVVYYKLHHLKINLITIKYMKYQKTALIEIYRRKNAISHKKPLNKNVFHMNIVQSIKCVKRFLEFMLIKRNNQTLTFFLLSP